MEKPHKRLHAWSASLDLAVVVYGTTDTFPKREQYGLADQMRRCVLSVPSNIAEGAARQSKKEFLHFLYIAKGSLSELDTQAELAKQLDYLSAAVWTELDSRMTTIDKMLSGLIQHVKSSAKGKG